MPSIPHPHPLKKKKQQRILYMNSNCENILCRKYEHFFFFNNRGTPKDRIFLAHTFSFYFITSHQRTHTRHIKMQQDFYTSNSSSFHPLHHHQAADPSTHSIEAAVFAALRAHHHNIHHGFTMNATTVPPTHPTGNEAAMNTDGSWDTWYELDAVTLSLASVHGLPVEVAALFVYQLRVLGFEFPTAFFQAREVSILVHRFAQYKDQFTSLYMEQQQQAASAALAGWCAPTTTAPVAPTQMSHLPSAHNTMPPAGVPNGSTAANQRMLCSQFRDRGSCSFGARCRYSHALGPHHHGNPTTVAFAMPHNPHSEQEQPQQQQQQSVVAEGTVGPTTMQSRKRRRETLSSIHPNILFTTAAEMSPHRVVNTAFLK